MGIGHIDGDNRHIVLVGLPPVAHFVEQRADKLRRCSGFDMASYHPGYLVAR